MSDENVRIIGLTVIYTGAAIMLALVWIGAIRLFTWVWGLF